MATIYNMKGTSFPSFTIGKKGSVIFQGTAAPTSAIGADGDLYIQHGGTGSQKLFQRLAGNWNAFQYNTARLDQLNALAAADNSFIGTDSQGLVIRNVTQSRTALGLGSAALLNAGSAAGNVPVLDSNGKLPVVNVPDISITSVTVVTSNTQRDALVVQQGDIAINTTEGMTYIYDGAQWRQIGYASTVQGIQGASRIKTGVVSLDTTDILSGVFTTQQGGTGYASFSKGDLLVGTTAGSLNKLPVGVDGKVLTLNGGTPVWGDLVASQLAYDKTNGLHMTTATVQTAIDELANTRTYVKAATTSPTNADYAGYRLGDLWVNINTMQVYIAVALSSSVATWQEVAKPALLNNMVVVASNGNDAFDGSYNRPVQSIAKAMQTVGSGGTILVMPGTYAENVTVNKSNVTVIGYNATLNGVLSVPLNGSSFVSRGMRYYNTSSNPVNVAGLNVSNVRFEGGIIEAATLNDYAVVLQDQLGAGVIFNDVTIKGKVKMAATSTNRVVVTGCDGGFGVEMVSGALTVSDTSEIQPLVHSGGNVTVRNVGRILADTSNRCVTSTAAGRVTLDGTSLMQTGGTFGTLSFSAATEYALNDVYRDTTQALDETKRIYGRNARDISASRTSTNYTVSDASVSSHLAGIDTALGSVVGAAIKTFKTLQDVTPYSTDDANRVVKINSDGTGLVYGYVLGTASQNNTGDFATASQGIKADTAVQPSDLSAVAKSGQGDFLHLTDAPASYTGTAKQLVRVKADESGLEFAGPLGKAAYSNAYGDLDGLPTLGTVAALDYGYAAGQIPLLDANGKLANSAMPALAITDVYVVANYDERDALVVQGGDVAKVTDTGQTFIFDGSTWIEMSSPDAVNSVNGKTGNIVLVGSDIMVVRTATNYSTSADSIKDHFDGVDAVLGTLATKSALADLSAALVAEHDRAEATYYTKDAAGAEHDYNASTFETKDDATAFQQNVVDTYQTKADATADKQTAADTYYTKTDAATEHQYNADTFYTKADAQAAGQSDSNNYQTKADAATFQQNVADTYETKAHAQATATDAANTFETKQHASDTYQTKTDAATAQTNADATYETKAHASATYAVQSDVVATYETKQHASDTYTTKADASATYETQTHAAATYAAKSDLNNYVGKSAFTAAGDLLVGTGAGTFSKLGKGTNGQTLSIDSNGNVVWSTPVAPATSLSALTDVALSSPTSGQVLTYNGTKWVNQTPAAGGSGSGDKITTGTTSVQTAEVANTVTVNANGKRVVNFVGGASTAGERLDITADNTKVTVAATNTAGSGTVDLEFKTQGAGQVKFNLAGTASMRSGPGEAITIQPGDATTGAGATLTLTAGATSASGAAGGDILLQPGTAGSGGSAGQVKLVSGYVPGSSDSVVNKNYVDNRRLDQLGAPTGSVSFNNQNITDVKDPALATDAANRRFVVSRTSQFEVAIVTTSDTYTVGTSDHMILVKRTTAVSTTVSLPASGTVSIGKAYTIKDAKGDSATNNITIRGANGETIDGATTQMISFAYESITVLWNGTEWNII